MSENQDIMDIYKNKKDKIYKLNKNNRIQKQQIIERASSKESTNEHSYDEPMNLI